MKNSEDSILPDWRTAGSYQDTAERAIWNKTKEQCIKHEYNLLDYVQEINIQESKKIKFESSSVTVEKPNRAAQFKALLKKLKAKTLKKFKPYVNG